MVHDHIQFNANSNAQSLTIWFCVAFISTMRERFAIAIELTKYLIHILFCFHLYFSLTKQLWRSSLAQNSLDIFAFTAVTFVASHELMLCVCVCVSVPHFSKSNLIYILLLPQLKLTHDQRKKKKKSRIFVCINWFSFSVRRFFFFFLSPNFIVYLDSLHSMRFYSFFTVHTAHSHLVKFVWRKNNLRKFKSK